jgi:hypothetical protein
MGTLVTDYEINLYHSVAEEVQHLAGIEVAYYRFSVSGIVLPNGQSGYDPLYGEKLCDASWGMTGQDGISSQSDLGQPYLVMGIFEHDEKNVTASERGQVTDSATQLWFARKEFDRLTIGEPRVGDVVKYRDTFWNVNTAIYDGWIDMSHKNFSLYKLSILYNSKLSASVKVKDPRLS